MTTREKDIPYIDYKKSVIIVIIRTQESLYITAGKISLTITIFCSVRLTSISNLITASSTEVSQNFLSAKRFPIT